LLIALSQAMTNFYSSGYPSICSNSKWSVPLPSLYTDHNKKLSGVLELGPEVPFNTRKPVAELAVLLTKYCIFLIVYHISYKYVIHC
jgi:hypothetical protein